MLRASTRTPTARIRRATAVKTSLTFRAVTLPLRTSARRPVGLDTALTSSRLLPPRQGHDCSGRRCHGRHHPSCQRAPAALLGLHNTEIPRQDSRPCGHRRRRYPSRAFRSPTRGDGRGHFTRPGTFLCGRGRSTPSGTGFRSPNSQAVPDRERTHPHAQKVPVEIGRPALMSIQCRTVPGQHQPGPDPTPHLIPVWYHLLLWRHGDDIALEQRG